MKSKLTEVNFFLLPTVLMVGVFISSCNSTSQIQSNSIVSFDSTKSREEIRSVLLAERKAWDARKAEEATANYADDIYWINAFGIEKHGKQEAKTFITRIFSQAGFNAAKSDKDAVVTDVRLLSKNVGWGHSYGESTGQLTNSGQAMAKRKTHIFYILRREKEQWMIVSFQVMDEKERIQ